MSKTKKILSIDWDVFFEGSESLHNPCDACSWLGNLCTGSDRKGTSSQVRPTTASLGSAGHTVTPENWLRRGDPLPTWFAPVVRRLRGCPVTVAECHGDIRELIEDGCTVINLDAHDDFNLDCHLDELVYDNLNCANWGYWLSMCKMGNYAWVTRPAEEQDAVCMENSYGSRTIKWKRLKYDEIFICTSRPWTPSWFDRRFYPFLKSVCNHTGTQPNFIGPSAKTMRRRYRTE